MSVFVHGRRLISFFFVEVVFVGILFFALPASASAGSLYLTPSSRSASPGTTFSISVRENSGGDLVNAVQANLSYPADKLDFLGVSGGGSAFGIAASSGGGNGGVSISRGTIGQGLSGDNFIASVSFRAKTSGTATIGINGALVRGADQANVFSGGAGSTISISGGSATGTTSTGIQQVSTPTPTPPNPPVISAVSANNISATQVTINWTTTVDATSYVEYGLSTSYGVSSTSADLTQSHEVVITSGLLVPGTTYHYRVRSAATDGQEAVSNDQTFTVPGYKVVLTVKDANNHFLPNTTVTLHTPNGDITATTDSRGIVTFQNAAPGKQVLSVKDAQPQVIDVKPGDLTTPQEISVKVAGIQKSVPHQTLLMAILAALLALIILFPLVRMIKGRKHTPPPTPIPPTPTPTTLPTSNQAPNTTPLQSPPPPAATEDTPQGPQFKSMPETDTNTPQGNV